MQYRDITFYTDLMRSFYGARKFETNEALAGAVCPRAYIAKRSDILIDKAFNRIYLLLKAVVRCEENLFLVQCEEILVLVQ